MTTPRVDLDDVPESVREELTVHLVGDVREVLGLAFELATATAAAALQSELGSQHTSSTSLRK